MTTVTLAVAVEAPQHSGLTGALGYPVTMRLFYPPDFDPSREQPWPVLHLLQPKAAL